MTPTFTGGVNIAVKIPKSKYEATVAFYRDTLGMDVQEKAIQNPTISRTHRLSFGANILWLDCVDNYAHAEVWMELKTPNLEEATTHLAAHNIHPCDELERLPPNAHWIQDPAGTVFVLNEEK